MLLYKHALPFSRGLQSKLCTVFDVISKGKQQGGDPRADCADNTWKAQILSKYWWRLNKCTKIPRSTAEGRWEAVK